MAQEKEEQNIAVKHANPFASAFKGTLGKGLGCVTIVIIVVVVIGALAAGGSEEKGGYVTEEEGKSAVSEERGGTEEAQEQKQSPKIEENDTEEAMPYKPEEAPKQQVVVAELSGNANKSSDTFRLSGGKATLTYDFKGDIAVVGAIYILKEGTDLLVDGGIPEVMVSEAGSDSTIIRKSAGDYYLQVNSANADYTVTIEEER